jgi:hypothetical protein
LLLLLLFGFDAKMTQCMASWEENAVSLVQKSPDAAKEIKQPYSESDHLPNVLKIVAQ